MLPLLHCCFIIIKNGERVGKIEIQHFVGSLRVLVWKVTNNLFSLLLKFIITDQMKQQRIMKVVQIQSNYQKHKQRLMSIQHIDTRKKQSVSTLRPSEASISYKQSRLKAEIHSFKSRNSRIQQQNMIMLNKIERQYGKTSNRKSRVELLSRSASSHSVRSNRSEKSIQDENIRIYQKINNTKSIYSNIRRENSQRNSVKQNTSKEQLLNLLVNQLGVKPTVLFPVVPRIIRPHKSFNNRTMQLRQKKSDEILLRNLQNIRKKHGFLNPTLPS